jgi:hypothetical protein
MGILSATVTISAPAREEEKGKGDARRPKSCVHGRHSVGCLTSKFGADHRQGARDPLADLRVLQMRIRVVQMRDLS